MRKATLTKVSLPGLLLAGLAPVATLAQSEALESSAQFATPVLEEVVVTAQKREENLKDVPISIAVISGEDIARANLLELEDLSAQIPGFTVAEAPVTTFIFMRGIGSGTNQGFEQSVGMYVDGVYAGRGRQFNASFLDLDRVEILRGPQGIIFGKNTVAGAVNITTAKPTQDFEAQLTALGDFDHGEYQFTGVASGPLTDSLSGRIAVKAGGFDGWMLNSALDREEVGVDDRVARGSLRWTPSDRLTVDFSYQYSDYQADGRTTQITEESVYGDLYRAFDPAFESELNTLKSVAGIGIDQSDTTSHLGILTVTYDWDTVSLNAVTGYSSYEYLDRVDVDFSPVPYLFHTQPQDFDQLSQEFRFQSDSEGVLSWNAGVYFETSSLTNRTAVDADLSYIGLPLPPTTRQIEFEQDTDTVALFAQAGWKMAERWRLNAGIRYTREDKSAQQSLWFADYLTMTPNPILAAIYAQVGFGIAHAFDESRDEDDWSPQVNLQFDVTDDVMLYGSAARGFKAGGFNEAETTGDLDNFEFENETSTTFELGAKMRLAGGAARLDLALFHTTYEDLQVSTFEGVNFVVGNAAEATSQGFELEGDWLLGDSFSLSASWTWLDSTYDRFPNAACTAAQIAEVGPACTQDLAGQSTTYAPKNAVRLGASWFHTMGSGHGLTADLVMTHSDGFYLQQDLDLADYQASFQKFDLRLGWTDPRNVWELALIGRNLTDEITRHHGADVSLLNGAHYSMTDRPRSIALQLRRSF